MYTSQALAEVWYRVLRLPYNSLQVVVIKDTGPSKRLADLGVVVVVSGRHREETERSIMFMMVDVNGGMTVCFVLVWCGRLVSLGAF